MVDLEKKKKNKLIDWTDKKKNTLNFVGVFAPCEPLKRLITISGTGTHGRGFFPSSFFFISRPLNHRGATSLRTYVFLSYVSKLLNMQPQVFELRPSQEQIKIPPLSTVNVARLYADTRNRRITCKTKIKNPQNGVVFFLIVPCATLEFTGMNDEKALKYGTCIVDLWSYALKFHTCGTTNKGLSSLFLILSCAFTRTSRKPG